MKRLKKTTTAMLISVMLITNSQNLVSYANEEIIETNIEISDENLDFESNKDSSNDDTKLELEDVIVNERKQERVIKEEIKDEKYEKALDVTSPELRSVSIDKKEVKPGDKVTISLDIVEGQSGIQYIEVEMVEKNIINYHFLK